MNENIELLKEWLNTKKGKKHLENTARILKDIQKSRMPDIRKLKIPLGPPDGIWPHQRT